LVVVPKRHAGRPAQVNEFIGKAKAFRFVQRARPLGIKVAPPRNLSQVSALGI
jgi:ribosomal protein L32E